MRFSNYRNIWIGFAAIVLSGLGGCSESEAPSDLRGVVVIALDTLRADRLGSYGANRPTPNLDALAERGVRFQTAISYGARTRPSFAAIFSGRFPTRRDFDRVLLGSLVENLQRSGWNTVAFTEGGEISRIYEFDRGFDYWWEEETPVTGIESGGIERTFARAEAWLRDRIATEPFFLFLHTYEVHLPYRRLEYAESLPRGNFPVTFETSDVSVLARGEIDVGPTERSYANALYDGGAAAADRHVGKFLQVLDEVGLTDDTMIIVLSDHGEELGERDPQYLGGHGHTLYDELIRVPLIIVDPARSYPRNRVDTQVRTVDVLVTVLDRLGIPIPPERDGKSLLPVMEGRERSDRVALSQTFQRDRKLRSAVRAKDRKLIFNQPDAQPELPSTQAFNLRIDPRETQDQSGEVQDWIGELRVVLDMRKAVESRDGAPHFGRPKDMPEAMKERLRSLGYAD